MKLRLFVAVDLDERGRDLVAEAIERLRAVGLEARFESREKWHATLAFLGATDPDRYGAVLGALADAAAQCTPFDLTLDTIGAFPSPARPRVVWVGSSSAQPGYVSCAARVREKLEALDYAFDDDATPHVTICRLRHAAGTLPAVALAGAALIPVPSITLYQSIPDGRTTRYAVRERIRLGSAM